MCQRIFFLEVSDFVDDAPNLMDEPPQTTDDKPLMCFHAIGNLVLTALLDTGSTHNFISSSAARRAGLHFQDSKGAHVVVANGDRVACRGLAPDVAVRIGDEFFTVDCYAIPLDCYDVVLGVQYLRTLGPILWDFDDLCMAFTRHGRRILWKGIGSTRINIRSPRRLYTARGLESAFLNRLLSSFDDVFATPSGLPPPRPCDHHIHLLLGTAPVAVRLYWYPQLQKDELEAQCTAMLEQGTIRTSTSPFSAPVLLVRKPDDSWRFCVDYRALNGRTVKDKFPIPVVEELIDELHGARFFTKLDLRAGYHQARSIQ